MKRILVAVDGSVRTYRAVKYLVELASHGERFEVVVLNVQPEPDLSPISGSVTRAAFEALKMRADIAIAHSLAKLATAHIPHKSRVEIADSELQGIARCARLGDCDHIVLAAEEPNPVTQKLKYCGAWPFRSFESKVADLTELPVTVVRQFTVEHTPGGVPSLDSQKMRFGLPYSLMLH